MSLTLLASGRTADVFALDERRVLRRYRDGADAAEEAAVMAYLAERGVPVPRVYQADGADLVMERLAGPTQLDSLVGGGIDPATAAEQLADLHTRLHAVPPPPFRVGRGPSANAEVHDQPGGNPATDPSARILHLDLHPGNVILSARGPVLIDWRDTAEGPPDLDLALTALILAEVAAGSYLPDFEAPASELLTGFLRLAGGDPVEQLDQAVAYRSAMSTLSAEEKARLATAAGLVVTSRRASSSYG